MPRRELLTEPERLAFTEPAAEFEFHAAPATADLMGGRDVLRELDATGKRTMPNGALTGFVKTRWRPHDLPDSDRCFRDPTKEYLANRYRDRNELVDVSLRMMSCGSRRSRRRRHPPRSALPRRPMR